MVEITRPSPSFMCLEDTVFQSCRQTCKGKKSCCKMFLFGIIISFIHATVHPPKKLTKELGKKGLWSFQLSNHNIPLNLKNKFKVRRHSRVASHRCQQEFIKKDRRKELLYYENLIRSCQKVLNQLVYIGKKVCIP